MSFHFVRFCEACTFLFALSTYYFRATNHLLCQQLFDVRVMHFPCSSPQHMPPVQFGLLLFTMVSWRPLKQLTNIKMNPLPFLTLLRFVYGLHTKHTSLLGKIFSLIQAALFLIATSSCSLIYTYLLITEPGQFTRFISNLTKSVSSLILFVSVCFNRERRSAFLPSIMKGLCLSDLRMIRRVDIALGIAVVGLWIMEIYIMSGFTDTFYLRVMAKMIDKPLDHWGVHLWKWLIAILYPVFISMTAFISGLLYAEGQFVMYRFACQTETYYKSTTSSLTVARMAAVRDRNSRCNQIVEELNTLFGFCPFLVYSMTFLELAVNIVDRVLNSNPASNSSLLLTILYIFEISSHGFSCVLMALVTEMSTNKFTDARKAALEIATVSSKDLDLRTIVKKTSLATDLIANPVVKSTAWGMFEVDKRFLLTFVSGLIPFTVMVVTTVMQVAGTSSPPQNYTS